MELSCIWEHNGNDSLLYCGDFPGAFARGDSLDAALRKILPETRAYCRWAGIPFPEPAEPVVILEKASDLQIRDADSDVLFPQERLPLSLSEYQRLKALVLKSARDFQALYDALPEKNRTSLSGRSTFYGSVPVTGKEMYIHTNSVTAYYFAEIGVDTHNDGSIFDCRCQGFQHLESQPDFLEKGVILGSYDEEWSLRKVLRRFLWHDRIHGKAMYRMALKTFGENCIPNIFCFDLG